MLIGMPSYLVVIVVCMAWLITVLMVVCSVRAVMNAQRGLGLPRVRGRDGNGRGTWYSTLSRSPRSIENTRRT